MNVKWWYTVVASCAVVVLVWLFFACTMTAPWPTAAKLPADWPASISPWLWGVCIFLGFMVWNTLDDILSELRGIRRKLPGKDRFDD